MPALKIKLRLQELQAIILLLLGWILAKCTHKEKDLWLFSERGTDARDNGYWMFRYVKENHPEINAKYIISKDSADIEKLSNWKKDLIQYESFRHRLLLWQANYLISTHICGFCPHLIRIVPFFRKLFGTLCGSNIIWLQHGVIQNDHPNFHAKSNSLNLLICGARPEAEFIRATFGYEKGIVKYTGLARFDNLHTKYPTRHQILLMPTWRRWLHNEDFTSSDYYNAFRTLLTNPNLCNILKSRKLQLFFFPHYEIQPYLSEFTRLDLPENIVIADKEHYDVQQLLKESALLITDYSSVFFDFAYMKKPILYFQFDEKKFRERHYAEGYFDYHDGLGQWTDNIDDLLEAIKKLADEGFKMPEQYLKKVNEFFPLYDTHNCERIFDAIKQLQ